MHALIIHQSGIMQQHLRAMLMAQGIQVTTQSAITNSSTYDVMLIDDTVPWEALPDATPIILCTISHDSTHMQKALSSGIDEIIMMPCDKEIMQSKLECVRSL